MSRSKISDVLKVEAPDNFCCIDASTHSMAFAYFINKKLQRYGKIRFSGENIYEKIGDTANKVSKFFAECPTENIIIEKTIFANSTLVAANLALSQGSLIGASKIGGVTNVYGVTPIAWQSYIGTRLLVKEEKDEIRRKTPGKSNSWYKNQEREKRKNKTIDTINNHFKINTDDNDIADACGIGMFTLDNCNKIVK
jgi:hypothetical protein